MNNDNKKKLYKKQRKFKKRKQNTSRITFKSVIHVKILQQ